jgi:chromosome segregation ATPase
VVVKRKNGKYVSMKDYVDNRFDEARAAVAVASTTANTRLDSMNEWRQTYGDAQANFPSRIELTTQLSEIKNNISDLSRDYREQSRALSVAQTQLAIVKGRLSALSVALASLSVVAGITVPILIVKLM